MEKLLVAHACTSNNGTKSTPALSVDLWGDWREEVIWRTRDNQELRIYTSTIPTEHRMVTFLHDPQYRVAIAWQNVAYNQPPHPSFYLHTITFPQPGSPCAAAQSSQRNENTLLNKYLREYLHKLRARIEHLEFQDASGNLSAKKKKEIDKLRKTLHECEEWERDTLLPLAQQRLEIDLDDGVKQNYPKFGKALANIPGVS